jgi:hypothetical protein
MIAPAMTRFGGSERVQIRCPLVTSAAVAGAEPQALGSRYVI